MFHHLQDYMLIPMGGPGKTLGQLTDETTFRVVRHIPGRAKPYLIAGKYTNQLGWVSV